VSVRTLFQDVTLADVALALLVTGIVEAGSFAVVGGFGSSRASSRGGAGDWAVAVRVVSTVTTPADVLPEHAPEDSHLKRGGGTGHDPDALRRAPVRKARTPAQRRVESAVHHSSEVERSTRDVIGVGHGRERSEATLLTTEVAGHEGTDDSLAPSDEALDAAPSGQESAWEGPQGPGFPDGTPTGTVVDPLRAHAIRLYRQRVEAWFAARFRVAGSGLPQSTLQAARVRARVSVDEHRRVQTYVIVASRVAAVDTAARAALDAVVGLELPPPPQDYPGAVQRQISITFVCREDACD